MLGWCVCGTFPSPYVNRWRGSHVARDGRRCSLLCWAHTHKHTDEKCIEPFDREDRVPWEWNGHLNTPLASEWVREREKERERAQHENARNVRKQKPYLHSPGCWQWPLTGWQPGLQTAVGFSKKHEKRKQPKHFLFLIKILKRRRLFLSLLFFRGKNTNKTKTKTKQNETRLKKTSWMNKIEIQKWKKFF